MISIKSKSKNGGIITVTTHRREGDITVAERAETGIFFRSPFFKRSYDRYCDRDAPGNVYDTLGVVGFLGFIHRILNRKEALTLKKEFMDEDPNASGYHLNSIRSPIYFRRNVRCALLEGEKLRIKSEGFHYLEEPVGGACEQEVTEIQIKKDGKWFTTFKGRTDRNSSYNCTYRHRLEKLQRELGDEGRPQWYFIR